MPEPLLTAVNLKGQCHENFVLTETVGFFLLGPTDMPEQLLTSVYCPFNLLRSLKMASIEVKQISSSCKTCMLVSVSVYKKYAN